MPTDVPVNFVLDPHREVTNTTADFVWDAISALSPGLNGFLRGYKVKDDIRIILTCIYKPTCWVRPVNDNNKLLSNVDWVLADTRGAINTARTSYHLSGTGAMLASAAARLRARSRSSRRRRRIGGQRWSHLQLVALHHSQRPGARAHCQVRRSPQPIRDLHHEGGRWVIPTSFFCVTSQ